MIERLTRSLEALAAPADTQLALYPNFATAEELARDYADALLLISDCPQIELTLSQRRALEVVEENLGRMSGVERAHLWTEAAVRSAEEWVEVRALARRALLALGVAD